MLVHKRRGTDQRCWQALFERRRRTAEHIGVQRDLTQCLARAKGLRETSSLLEIEKALARKRARAQAHMVEVRRIRVSPPAIRIRSTGWRPSPASPTDRPLACPLNGSALHRVRFSAAHEKAGHGCDAPRPADSSWWRCGESNSGPKPSPGRCLQAQSSLGIRVRRTWRPALRTLAGSILACGIPATSAGASP